MRGDSEASAARCRPRNRASNSARVAIGVEGAAMVDASFSLRSGAAEPRLDPRYPRPCWGCRRRSDRSPTDQTGACRLQSRWRANRADGSSSPRYVAHLLPSQTGDMSTGRVVERPVRVPTASVSLDGDLAVPVADSRGVVLFAHGSGSSRQSPRNRRVASVLQKSGWATLLLDLLTPQEEQVDLRTREFAFDISRLAERLTGVLIGWASRAIRASCPWRCSVRAPAPRRR